MLILYLRRLYLDMKFYKQIILNYSKIYYPHFICYFKIPTLARIIIIIITY